MTSASLNALVFQVMSRLNVTLEEKEKDEEKEKEKERCPAAATANDTPHSLSQRSV